MFLFHNCTKGKKFQKIFLQQCSCFTSSIRLCLWLQLSRVLSNLWGGRASQMRMRSWYWLQGPPLLYIDHRNCWIDRRDFFSGWLHLLLRWRKVHSSCWQSAPWVDQGENIWCSISRTWVAMSSLGLIVSNHQLRVSICCQLLTNHCCPLSANQKSEPLSRCTHPSALVAQQRAPPSGCSGRGTLTTCRAPPAPPTCSTCPEAKNTAPTPHLSLRTGTS